MGEKLSWVDGASLAAYFILLAWVAVHASRKKAGKGTDEPGEAVSQYFLAERSVGFAAVAASLFSSNIGAEHFVGLAGTSAYSGVAVSFYELGAIPCLLFLGYFFLPIFVAARVKTVPEWLERRYSGFCRTFVVVLSLFLYIFTKISATLFAGQLILAEVSHLDRWSSAIALILATALYTLVGGLSAVVYTEALQTIVLIAGGVILCGAGLKEVGGIGGLAAQLEGEVPDTYFHIIRPVTDAEFPWPGLLVGYFCVSLWYWTCDQVIVQRAMSSRSILHGRAGCTGAAALKLLPGIIMVLPGVMARVLMTRAGEVGPESPRSEYDRAFAWSIMNVLPRHSRGLLLAAMASALMSSLSSVFNSAATLFSLDVWRRVRPSAPQSELVWTGRACVVVIAALSVAWLPLVPMLGDQLFMLIQKPASYSGPAIFAVYFWGAVTERAGSFGAAAALVGGVSVGTLRFALELHREVAMGGRGYGIFFVDAFSGVNFLYFACLEFVGASIMLFASPAPSERERARASVCMYKKGIFWRTLVEGDATDAMRDAGRDRLLGACEVEMAEGRTGSRWDGAEDAGRRDDDDNLGVKERCREAQQRAGGWFEGEEGPSKEARGRNGLPHAGEADRRARGGQALRGSWEKQLRSCSRVVDAASVCVFVAFLGVVVYFR